MDRKRQRETQNPCYQKLKQKSNGSSSDISVKNKGINKMDYSRSGRGKEVLKRPGLQNSSTNHHGSATQIQTTHVANDVPSTFFSKLGKGVLKRPGLQNTTKPFSHNPTLLRGGSKKRTRNEDLEDHPEVNSPQTYLHTNDPQSEEHIGSTSNGKTVTRKETRDLGATKRNRLNNRKLLFEVDECAGRIVGDDSQIFITKGGCLVRERAKFDGTTWRKQEPSLKTNIISKCTENSSFKLNCPSMLHAIDSHLANQHKSRRWRLHNHYKNFPTKEQAIMNPPKGVKVQDWVLLSERFASEDFQKLSARNKENRSKNQIPPTVGTKSMARVVHTKTKRGEKVTAIGGFEICHFSKKKNGMINDKADEILIAYLQPVWLILLHSLFYAGQGNEEYAGSHDDDDGDEGQGNEEYVGSDDDDDRDDGQGTEEYAESDDDDDEEDGQVHEEYVGHDDDEDEHEHEDFI